MFRWCATPLPCGPAKLKLLLSVGVVGENITATLTFDAGVTATLLLERFPIVDNQAYMIEVIGTEGRLFWKTAEAWVLDHPHFVPSDGNGDNNQPQGWSVLPVVPQRTAQKPLAVPADEADFGFADDFVAALDDDRSHVCSGEEGIHVMEVLMGIFESAAYNRPVGLPQADRSHPLLRWRAENGLAPPDVRSVPRAYYDWLEAEDRRLGREVVRDPSVEGFGNVPKRQ